MVNPWGEIHDTRGDLFILFLTAILRGVYPGRMVQKFQIVIHPQYSSDVLHGLAVNVEIRK